jgi:hypothetical protein
VGVFGNFYSLLRRNRGLLFKGTLIGVGVALCTAIALAVSFAPLLGFWATQWFTYDRHFQSIRISATPRGKECPDAAKPILVEITNGSSRTVVESSFWLNATRPGSSFDVSNGGEWNGDIIAAGETLRTCAPAALIEDATGEDPQRFSWSAGLSWVRLEN